MKTLFSVVSDFSQCRVEHRANSNSVTQRSGVAERKPSTNNFYSLPHFSSLVALVFMLLTFGIEQAWAIEYCGETITATDGTTTAVLKSLDEHVCYDDSFR